VAEPDAVARFNAIYDVHHDQVYAYAVSRAGRQLADEVVSETFLVAWRRLPVVPAAPLPWLLGSVDARGGAGRRLLDGHLLRACTGPADAWSRP
jgi:RNA polymerase sigma-70 factor (ECF subfamily)